MREEEDAGRAGIAKQRRSAPNKKKKRWGWLGPLRGRGSRWCSRRPGTWRTGDSIQLMGRRLLRLGVSPLARWRASSPACCWWGESRREKHIHSPTRSLACVLFFAEKSTTPTSTSLLFVCACSPSKAKMVFSLGLVSFATYWCVRHGEDVNPRTMMAPLRR